MNHPVQPSPSHTTGRTCGTLPSPTNYISEERITLVSLKSFMVTIFCRLDRMLTDVANRSWLPDSNEIMGSQSGRSYVVGIHFRKMQLP